MTQIRDLMTENPSSCERGTPVAEAAKVMAREDVGSVPVVEGGKLVGVVTDRDLVVRVLSEGRDPKSTTVGEVASSELVTLSPDDGLDQALQLLARHQVRRLPVVEGERLVGIVAQADIARHADEVQTGEVVEEISKP
ncbi:MAG TPA: CBS domain-containing protein [Gaiellaceae bacterium]|jgi:CBS domain-containing protein|nr:CBS domain-containing protein [Gaiellaceae bacterium]